MPDLSGRIAIVTGGTSGIGAAVTGAFLQAGAVVTAIYAGNDEKAEAFTHQCDAGDRLKTVKLDVGNYTAVEAFYQQFNEANEKLDILVNSAGIRRDAVMAMMKPEDWNDVININLTGTYNMSKFAVMSMMRKRYGRIINITSPAGRVGFEGQANYSASKAAQVALTKSLSKEVAKRNITVNCVSPGFIDTDFIGDLPEAMADAYKNSVPMKRFGKASEVAPAVLFMASESASYVTGAVLEVTGGL